MNQRRRLPIRRKVVWWITNRLWRMRDWLYGQAAVTYGRSSRARPICVWCKAIQYIALRDMGTALSSIAMAIAPLAYSKSEREADARWRQSLQQSREKT
jgi:hypothetical protein